MRKHSLSNAMAKVICGVVMPMIRPHTLYAIVFPIVWHNVTSTNFAFFGFLRGEGVIAYKHTSHHPTYKP